MFKKQRVAHTKTATLTTIFVALLLVMACCIYPKFIKPGLMYNNAHALLLEEKFDDAIVIFEELDNYRDSEERVKDAYYRKAIHLKNNDDLDGAIAIFEELGDDIDATGELETAYYQKAKKLKDSGDIENAIVFLELAGYTANDAEYLELQHMLAVKFLEANRYDEAKRIFLSIMPYKNSSEMVLECDYQKASFYFETGKYFEAIEIFDKIQDYSNAAHKMTSAYSYYYLECGIEAYNEARFNQAIELLQKSYEPEATEVIVKIEKELDFINEACGTYYLVEAYFQGRSQEISSSKNDFCEVLFDFEKAQFVFNNIDDIYDLLAEYNPNQQAEYRNKSNLIEGAFFYKFDDGRLILRNTLQSKYYEKL